MTEEDVIRFLERSQEETLERVARALDGSGAAPSKETATPQAPTRPEPPSTEVAAASATTYGPLAAAISMDGFYVTTGVARLPRWSIVYLAG